MSNVLAVTGSINYTGQGSPNPKAVTALQVTVAANGRVDGVVAASTVEAAIPLGGLTALRWAWFHNLDSTNNITIKASNGGQKMWTLLPGEFAEGPLDTSINAPTFVSNAGSPLLEYEIYPP